MNDYTPSTEQIRARYTAGDGDNTEWYESMFNRWLAEVERSAAQKAWDEGWTKGAESERISFGRKVSYKPKKNPYRKEQ